MESAHAHVDGHELKFDNVAIIVDSPLLVNLYAFDIGYVYHNCYYKHMIEARGPTLASLDALASEPDKPHAVITADCSGAHEFDDAISVTPLPCDTETYRVDVFSVDTSKLYFDEAIVRRAMTLTESRYNVGGTGVQSYKPMLDRDMTQRLHFARGMVKNALSVSFMVGVNDPPSDVQIGFGRVEVKKNLRYNTFGNKCRYSQEFEPYGRAAALILSHLNIDPDSTEEMSEQVKALYQGMIHVPATDVWKRGAVINQTYMIAANYLFGRHRQALRIPTIYRAHDSTIEHDIDVFSPMVARYTANPTAHHGLGLDVYARVTSPLRRLEDFINVGIEKLHVRGRQTSPRETKIVTGSIQRLNQRVAAEQFAGPLMLGRYDQKPSPRPVVPLAIQLSEAG